MRTKKGIAQTKKGIAQTKKGQALQLWDLQYPGEGIALLLFRGAILVFILLMGMGAIIGYAKDGDLLSLIVSWSIVLSVAFLLLPYTNQMLEMRYGLRLTPAWKTATAFFSVMVIASLLEGGIPGVLMWLMVAVVVLPFTSGWLSERYLSRKIALGWRILLALAIIVSYFVLEDSGVLPGVAVLLVSGAVITYCATRGLSGKAADKNKPGLMARIFLYPGESVNLWAVVRGYIIVNFVYGSIRFLLAGDWSQAGAAIFISLVVAPVVNVRLKETQGVVLTWWFKVFVVVMMLARIVAPYSALVHA